MNPRRLERTDEDVPRKLPNVEREARRAALARRLTGLRLVGELDVSHALTDLATTIYDNDVLQYIPLAKCTKRDQEVLGTKKAADWKDYVADTTSTRKLGLAWQRRALAMDIAGMCPYEVQMTVIDRFMELLDNDIDGISVTVAQTIKADEMLFVETAKLCRAGIKCSPGVSPIGDCLLQVFETQRIQLLLTPRDAPQRQRQKPTASVPKVEQPNPAQPGNPKKRRGNHQQPNGTKQEHLATVPTKGKGKGKSPNMPQAMIGTCTPKYNGVNLCFGYNLKTCPHNVEPGTSCPRGLHACAKLRNGTACGGEHAFSDCR